MIATYRLQLGPDFGFADVVRIVPYLKELGISHLYLSPITEASFGSTHGYDVTDHNRIREELGGEVGFNELRQAVREQGLKLILDFVPNHAGVGPLNAGWQHVLAFGRHSKFANYFDIDWEPLEVSLQDKVLLPFLGRTYGECLDSGEIQIARGQYGFAATYGDSSFALAPMTYSDLILEVMADYERSETYFDLKELQEGFASLRADEVERAEMLQRRLDVVAEKVNWESALSRFQSLRLHALLERQHWRLAYWKAASYEINYRRFFDVNGLFALRIQEEHVFWSSHQLIASLLTHEEIAGIRIDHIDGLHDPQSYLVKLKELGAKQVWVEKILAAGERLPQSWPVEGTTGYEFMNEVMSVLIDPAGWDSVTRIYQRFVHDDDSLESIIRESKRLVIETSLSSELHRLAYGLNRVCKADYHTRDFTLGALREALVELIAAIGLYRTYLPHDVGSARDTIARAIELARRRTPSFEPTIYDFIAKAIFGELPQELESIQQAWVGRFQQYCSAVAAKGVEDTAFYRFIPLLALNEVGGLPEVSEQPVQSFHSRARYRAKFHPRCLIATATHDHKRGEDTRMRLIAITQEPDRWDEALKSLSRLGEAYCGLTGPTRHDQYFFFQILTALWSSDDTEALQQRLVAYMQKAIRESKYQTSWNHPKEEYEKTVMDFIDGILGDEQLPELIEPLARTLAELGFRNAIVQLILKLTSPGIPDIYQGCELLDLSLVDPDNRRAVDYERRCQLLEEYRHADAAKVQNWFGVQDERLKLFLTARLLNFRREHERLFEDGSYREVQFSDGCESWIGFSREFEGEVLLVIVPRLQRSVDGTCSPRVKLEGVLQGRVWNDVLTNVQLDCHEALDLGAVGLKFAVLYSGATQA